MRVLSIALLAAATSTTACLVPQARYDELAAQHAVEKQKSAKLSQQLTDMGGQLAQAQQTLNHLEERLSGSENELAKNQATLESTNQNLADIEYQNNLKDTERKEAEGLVGQLREELTRVAGHIATLSAAKDQLRDERDQLQAQVTQLQGRVDALAAANALAQQKAEVTRNLSVKLAEPLRAGSLSLDVVGPLPSLKIEGSALFDANAALSVEGRKLLGQVAKALAEPPLQVQVSERASKRSAKEREAHIRQVAGELHAGGVALDQIGMADDPTPPDALDKSGKVPAAQIVLKLQPKGTAKPQQ
ncbi:MAG TPA: hypothetical protein VHM70_04030 [Polyangiaceae bacterium]|jgi:DNA repair exonuclease SbcCD ATPase subunit|nr:hypothetical protein [Polyangiaceae bacterium]